MNPQVKTIEGKTVVENSYVAPSSLTKEEYDTWALKDIALKCIGGLPDGIDNIRLAEIIRYENDNSLIAGVCRWGQREIVISRSTLYRKEDFLGVLMHELAHAKSEAGDLTKEFEDELTNMLGYLAASLCEACHNNVDNVIPAKSLDYSSFAYFSCICPKCLSSNFYTNEDKSYVRCEECGAEFLGGYSELVDLNRKLVMERGLGIYQSQLKD